MAATRILAGPQEHLASLNFLLGLVSDLDTQVRPGPLQHCHARFRPSGLGLEPWRPGQPLEACTPAM